MERRIGSDHCAYSSLPLALRTFEERRADPPPPPLRKGGSLFAAGAPSYSPPCEGGAGGGLRCPVCNSWVNRCRHIALILDAPVLGQQVGERGFPGQSATARRSAMSIFSQVTPGASVTAQGELTGHWPVAA